MGESECRVPCQVHDDGRRSSNGVVDGGVYNNGTVWFILVPFSAPYERRDLPPVLLDALCYVMRILDGVPPNGSNDPRSMK